MFLRPTSALFACALLLGTLTSQAQLSYHRIDRAAEGLSSRDEGPERAPTKKMKLVHGVIQGEQGVLIGATVWLRGTRNIAVTNSEGEFELSVPADAKTVELLCSYGGLQEEVVHLAPVEAMGSVYLLRSKNSFSSRVAPTR